VNRIDVSEEESAYIAARVSAFGAEASSDWQWQGAYVQRFGALPLFLGWTETLAIQPDGTLVRWATEGDYDDLRSIDTQVEVNLALISGAKRYPRLARLVPKAPANALICTQCHGTGRLSASDDPLVCSCGGAGWVRPEEARHSAQPIHGGRALSSRERDLIEGMLRSGSPNPEGFLAHLAVARVVGRCACGCASIDLAVPGEHLPTGGLRVIVDFIYGDGASLCGAFLFERDGWLAGLEVYGLGNVSPTSFPALADLRPFAESSHIAAGLKPDAG
jgi:hypothetical protein